MMWWLGLGSILRLLLEIIGKIPIKFPVISPTYLDFLELINTCDIILSIELLARFPIRSNPVEVRHPSLRFGNWELGLRILIR